MAGPKRKVQVTWYGDAYAQIVERNGEDALFAAGEIVLNAAEARAPRGRSGNLKRSGYVSTAKRSTYVRRPYWRKEKKPPAEDTVTVGFNAPHAHLLESGRRRAGRFGPRTKRGKRALLIGGRYRSSSRYRRMSARPYLGPAIDATQETMVQELANVLNKALEGGMRK